MDQGQRIAEKIKAHWAWLALGLILLAFASFKIYFHNIKFSDGPIYLYMASRLLRGEWPYRDFLYANPLGHLFALSPWVAAFEDYAKYLNLLAGLTQMGNAVLIFRYMQATFSSALTALLTAFVFLFSFSVVATSDHLTGIHISIFWILLTANLVQSDRPYWGALAGAAGLLTRFYCLPWLVGIFIGAFLRNRRLAWNFGFALAALFIVGLGTHFLISPDGVYDQLFRYHFLKKEGIPKPRIIKFFFAHDGLMLLGLMGIPFLWKRRLFTPPAATLLCITFLYFYIDIYYFYLLPSILGLALCLGAVIDALEKKFPSSTSKAILVLAASGYVGLSVFNYFDNTHIADSVENFDEIVKFIHENSRPEQTIFGTAEIVPLISLESHRRIVGSLADTNVKTVLTGIINPTERFQKVLKLGVKFLITAVTMNQKGEPLGIDLLVPPPLLLQSCRVSRGFPLRYAQGANFLIIWDCERP